MRLPGYTFIDLGPDGGPYDEKQHPKVIWHTMETMNIGAAESRYDEFPPHCGVVPPWPGYEKQTVKRQYVDLDRHSFALSGSENDDEYVIQVEVAGFAKDMRFAPEIVLRWLVTEVLLPIEAAIGVPRVAAPQGFHDERDVPAGNGPLASKSSKIRFTSDGLRKFSGHMGHQHAPSPDQHWDPGALPIQRMFEIAASITNPTEDDDMITGFDKSPEDVARATIRELCDAHWGKGKMTTADQTWLLGIWKDKGREAMMTSLTDHAKNA